MRNIFSGAVIIAIGLVRGDSVFRGEFTIFSIAFDVLGLFFIGRGVLQMIRARRSAMPASRP